jgi:hypothetical protein
MRGIAWPLDIVGSSTFWGEGRGTTGLQEDAVNLTTAYVSSPSEIALSQRSRGSLARNANGLRVISGVKI